MIILDIILEIDVYVIDVIRDLQLGVQDFALLRANLIPVFLPIPGPRSSISCT